MEKVLAKLVASATKYWCNVITWTGLERQGKKLNANKKEHKRYEEIPYTLTYLEIKQIRQFCNSIEMSGDTETVQVFYAFTLQFSLSHSVGISQAEDI